MPPLFPTLTASLTLSFTGAIYFVSDAYPGSIGDPDLTRVSGFLDLMIRGLDVMAGVAGVFLPIPPARTDVYSPPITFLHQIRASYFKKIFKRWGVYVGSPL